MSRKGHTMFKQLTLIKIAGVVVSLAGAGIAQAENLLINDGDYQSQAVTIEDSGIISNYEYDASEGAFVKDYSIDLATQDELSLTKKSLENEIAAIDGEVDISYTTTYTDLNGDTQTYAGTEADNADQIFFDQGTDVTVKQQITIGGTVITTDGSADATNLDFSEINDKVGSVESGLSSVSTDVSSISTDLSGVKSNVGALESNLNSVSTDVSSISTNVDSISTDLTGVKSNVGAIESDLATVKSDLDAVKNTLSANLDAAIGNVGTIVSAEITAAQTAAQDYADANDSDTIYDDTEIKSSLASSVETLVAKDTTLAAEIGALQAEIDETLSQVQIFSTGDDDVDTEVSLADAISKIAQDQAQYAIETHTGLQEELNAPELIYKDSNGQTHIDVNSLITYETNAGEQVTLDTFGVDADGNVVQNFRDSNGEIKSDLTVVVVEYQAGQNYNVQLDADGNVDVLGADGNSIVTEATAQILGATDVNGDGIAVKYINADGEISEIATVDDVAAAEAAVNQSILEAATATISVVTAAQENQEITDAEQDAAIELKASIDAVNTLKADLEAEINAAKAATIAAEAAAADALKAETVARNAAITAASVEVNTRIDSIEVQWEKDKVLQATRDGDQDRAIIAVADRVSKNEANIANLDSRVTANSVAISDLDSRVSANEADIATIKTILEDHESRLFNLENPVVAKETRFDKYVQKVWADAKIAKKLNKATYLNTSKGVIDMRAITSSTKAGITVSKTFAYDIMGWNTVWIKW